MWGRCKEAASKVATLARAARFSRGVAAGTGGIFFVLKSIFSVPLERFLGGYGPAASALAVSLVSFIYKLRENHQASNPDAPAQQSKLKEQQQKLSTNLIVQEFMEDSHKTIAF